jgi:hypothetical protein
MTLLCYHCTSEERRRRQIGGAHNHKKGNDDYSNDLIWHANILVIEILANELLTKRSLAIV